MFGTDTREASAVASRSIARTRAPRLAKRRACRPRPQATSSTDAPGPINPENRTIQGDGSPRSAADIERDLLELVPQQGEDLLTVRAAIGGTVGVLHEHRARLTTIVHDDAILLRLRLVVVLPEGELAQPAVIFLAADQVGIRIAHEIQALG